LLALINFFVELCLLRRAPQDLPASQSLFGLLVVVNLILGLLAGLTVDGGFGRSLLQSVADVVLTLGVFYAGFKLIGREARFAQTATALLGSGAVLGVLGLLPLTMLSGGEESAGSAIAGLLFLGLLIWNLVVMGHILRHALEMTLGQAMVIAVGFYLFAYTLLGGLFATPA